MKEKIMNIDVIFFSIKNDYDYYPKISLKVGKLNGVLFK